MANARLAITLLAAVAVTLSCREAKSPESPEITLPDRVLAVGDSVFLQYKATEINRIGVQLNVNDTVDIGLFASLGSHLTHLELSHDSPAASDSVLTLSDTVDWRSSTIYPALVARSTGMHVFKVFALPAFCVGGPPGSCQPSGSYHLLIRRSGPIAVLSSLAAPNGITGQAFVPSASGLTAIGGPTVLAYGGRESSGLLDTLLIENVGNGSFTYSATIAQPWLRLEPPEQLVTGPRQSPSSSAKRFVLEKTGLAPGEYLDTLRLGGAPADLWNHRAPQKLGIRLRVAEDAGTSVAMENKVSHVAVSPTGDIVATLGNLTLYRLDPTTGALSALQALPFQTTGLRLGADSALYLSLYGSQTDMLWRLKNGVLTRLIENLDGIDFVILPDGSIYTISFDGTRLTRRSSSLDQQVEVRLFSAPARAAGLVFNPVDSSLYYMAGGILYRRHLRSQTESAMGSAFEGNGPVAVDRHGFIYVRMPGEHLAVVDTLGTVVDRRWPPSSRLGAVVVRGDSLIGAEVITGFVDPPPAVWTLPIRTYAPRSAPRR